MVLNILFKLNITQKIGLVEPSLVYFQSGISQWSKKRQKQSFYLILGNNNQHKINNEIFTELYGFTSCCYPNLIEATLPMNIVNATYRIHTHI